RPAPRAAAGARDGGNAPRPGEDRDPARGVAEARPSERGRVADHVSPSGPRRRPPRSTPGLGPAPAPRGVPASHALRRQGLPIRGRGMATASGESPRVPGRRIRRDDVAPCLQEGDPAGPGAHVCARRGRPHLRSPAREGARPDAPDDAGPDSRAGAGVKAWVDSISLSGSTLRVITPEPLPADRATLAVASAIRVFERFPALDGLVLGGGDPE